ncbi:hypothetical protein D3C72_1471310 [compost metagenome]
MPGRPVTHGGVKFGEAPAGKQGELGFVGNQDCRLGCEGCGAVEERRGVEDGGNALRARQLERPLGRCLRNFLLHQHHPAADPLQRRIRIGCRHGAIGARQNGDDILAMAVHEDHGNAGGALHHLHGGEIDPIGLEQSQRQVGKGVVAHARHMAHAGAGAPCGQRLVGALAARGHREGAPGHGLARLGQAADSADLVEIGRAEDGDHASIFSIVFQLRIVSSTSLPSLA